MHYSGDLQAETRWLRKGYYLPGENDTGILPKWRFNYTKKGVKKKKKKEDKMQLEYNILFEKN